MLRQQSASSIDPFIISYVDAKVDKVKAEMSAEVTKLEATVKAAEAQRSLDYKALADSIRDAGSSLPTKATIRNWVLTGFGGVIAAAALAWSIFDTGAGVTGAFADKVLETRDIAKVSAEQSAAVNAKLDKLLAAQGKRNDDAKGSAGRQPPK